MYEENIFIDLVAQIKIPKKPRLKLTGDGHVIIKEAFMGSHDVPVMVKLFDEPEIGRGFVENTISHPSVLKYLGEIKDSYDECYFVYEKYKMSLEDLLKDRNFIRTENNRASYCFREIIKDIFIALEYLHSLDICHGKISPKNIALIQPKESAQMQVDDKFVVKLMGITNTRSFAKDYQGVADIVKEFMDDSCNEANHFAKLIKDATE